MPDSLLPYYWLPHKQYLVAAYDLYLRYQYSMMARPVPLSLSILVFTLAMFTRIFKILSKNFESFDEAWGAFKAFTRECYKKNRLMLSALLAPPLLGASIGTFYLLALPYGPRLMGFFLHCAINYFLYSSPLLVNLEILIILIIMHYTQTGLINAIYGILFIVLLIALISWRYDSSFWNRLKSLSPESFKPST
ncbi:MAG: hypothetical protein ACUVXA_16855 [Candidatus Jordarchaeum sp.]|uniref:hypothetical protein n=1 Tax=Candidatus Jordarchaeum sp. TaxID=2823881 RepID=UPI0040494ED0